MGQLKIQSRFAPHALPRARKTPSKSDRWFVRRPLRWVDGAQLPPHATSITPSFCALFPPSKNKLTNALMKQHIYIYGTIKTPSHEVQWKSNGSSNEANAKGNAKGYANGNAEGNDKGNAKGNATGNAEGNAKANAKGNANCMLQSTLKVDIISVLMFLRARPTSMLKTTTIPRIE
jgi:hypothetical protein